MSESWPYREHPGSTNQSLVQAASNDEACAAARLAAHDRSGELQGRPPPPASTNPQPDFRTGPKRLSRHELQAFFAQIASTAIASRAQTSNPETQRIDGGSTRRPTLVATTESLNPSGVHQSPCYAFATGNINPTVPEHISVRWPVFSARVLCRHIPIAGCHPDRSKVHARKASTGTDALFPGLCGPRRGRPTSAAVNFPDSIFNPEFPS